MYNDMTLEILINMHSSYFFISIDAEDHSQKEFTASGEMSEWLFHEKFWDEFNCKYHTCFEQYEDDYLPQNLIRALIESLQNLIAELSETLDDEVNFDYGWNEKKEVLFCTISSIELIKEISNFIILLKKAAALRADVYCQL